MYGEAYLEIFQDILKYVLNYKIACHILRSCPFHADIRKWPSAKVIIIKGILAMEQKTSSYGYPCVSVSGDDFSFHCGCRY